MDFLEILYEKAMAQGDRNLTGRDLAGIIDEARREHKTTSKTAGPSPYDPEGVRKALGIHTGK